jgi:hypothetical protein
MGKERVGGLRKTPAYPFIEAAQRSRGPIARLLAQVRPGSAPVRWELGYQFDSFAICPVRGWLSYIFSYRSDYPSSVHL